MARLAILCPGQGGQHPQMFDLVGARRRAALLEEWELQCKLGMPLDEILKDDKALFENRLAQPLIVAATTMMWLELKDALPPPAMVAGYSIGELSSYVVAGALSPAHAIDLALARAQLMDACASGPRPQALLSASGLAVRDVRAQLAGYDAHIAIETAEDSVIVGGYRDALHELQARFQERGARCRLLPVAVASHTPLMAGAVAPFAALLQAAPVSDPAIPVLSGITAEWVSTRTEARACLPRQIGETIRWMECMDALAEAGADVVLELGPGSALSRMMQARHPDIPCRSVAEFRSVEGVAGWVERQG